MRGLTAEEYELMKCIGENRQMTADEEICALSLYLSGRARFDDVGNRVFLRFTPAGREAMKLHEFLAAMGAG